MVEAVCISASRLSDSLPVLALLLSVLLATISARFAFRTCGHNRFVVEVERRSQGIRGQG